MDARLYPKYIDSIEAERAIDELYCLAWRAGAIDPIRVAKLLATPGINAIRDVRMQMLVRDALRGLRKFWGYDIYSRRLLKLGAPSELLDREYYPELDGRGYHSFLSRVMNQTDPSDIVNMFRDLGRRVRQPTSLNVGGSIVLILESLIIHSTQDIDVVDEVPAALREDHELLHEMVARHKLQLTHFQSHYLPEGWMLRLKTYGVFNRLTVRLVDPIDMLVCKLFSRRPKDFTHVREAWDLIDHDEFRRRLSSSTNSYRSEPQILEQGKHNWYVLTGEENLPPLADH